MIPDPTRKAYNRLSQAYEHLNVALFDGMLPKCVITMQRRNNSYGYFVASRFSGAESDSPLPLVDEIAMSPVHVANRSAIDVLATLAHDMTHLWQHHFGVPSRPSYHNRGWSERMIALGLIPLDGQATGQKVSYGIEKGGAFERACQEFLASGPVLLYQDQEQKDEERKKKAASKTRYTCLNCGLNAWAKPSVSLRCGDCDRTLQAVPKKKSAARLCGSHTLPA